MTQATGRFARLAAALVFCLVPAVASAGGQVNVYTFREPVLVKPLLDAFTARTGIGTRMLFIDRSLDQRIAAEGPNSPADVILTVDIGKLTVAKARGIVQPVIDEAVNAEVEARYRDPDGQWFGLTRDARVILASKDRVKEDHISYADLAGPEWKGRICIRSGQHESNIALFAAMIAHWGKDRTEAWMRAFKGNLARRPDGSDLSQAKSILSGECDVALVNTSAVAGMLADRKDPQQQDYARSLKVIFPDFGAGAGTHVNISGMALAKYAPNRSNALKLMEFLAGADSQKLLAAKALEYPVTPGLAPSEAVAGLGPLDADTLPLAEIDANRMPASLMVSEVGLNGGPGG
jgi:iron(III) transport system substrate-binding protein